MSEVTRKVAYLRGLAEGMGLDREEDGKSKLMLRMLEAMEEMAEALDAAEARLDETAQYIDELDSDLGDVEEVLFADEEEDCDCGCGHAHSFADEEDEDAEEGEEDEDGGMDFIEYECPHCHTSVYYDPEAFDLEEEHKCPECGKELFPNLPDEEE